MSITKVEKLPLKDGPYSEKTVGHLTVHESRFISTSNNLVSDQWVSAVNINIGGDVFVVLFTTPQTSSQADFNQFGSQMFADLRINGLPIKEHATS